MENDFMQLKYIELINLKEKADIVYKHEYGGIYSVQKDRYYTYDNKFVKESEVIELLNSAKKVVVTKGLNILAINFD